MMMDKIKRECMGPAVYSDGISLNDIEEPERAKFKAMMEKHEYL